jgi:protein-S-isoprenylcysteine O-methyltransferase Ste14
VRRFFALPLGVLAYVAAVAPMVYLVGFLAGVYVGKTVDGPPFVPARSALAIDLALLGSFAVVHSLLARERLKRTVARLVSPELERSVYSLVAGLQIAALLGFWRALPAPVWQLEAPLARGALWALYLAGWGVVVASLLAVDSFRLFGLAQAWDAARGRRSPEPAIVLRGPYRWVRHPLYSGTLLALFAAPTMSRGRLLFAAAFTLYMLVGMRFEERDLERRFGASWRDYRRAVPALLPRLGARRPAPGATLPPPSDEKRASISP